KRVSGGSFPSPSGKMTSLTTNVSHGPCICINTLNRIVGSSQGSSLTPPSAAPAPAPGRAADRSTHILVLLESLNRGERFAAVGLSLKDGLDLWLTVGVVLAVHDLKSQLANELDAVVNVLAEVRFDGLPAFAVHLGQHGCGQPSHLVAAC